MLRAPAAPAPWFKANKRFISQALEEVGQRLVRLEGEIETLITTSAHAATIAALQAMRGVGPINGPEFTKSCDAHLSIEAQRTTHNCIHRSR